jgi:hypothetical protein
MAEAEGRLALMSEEWNSVCCGMPPVGAYGPSPAATWTRRSADAEFGYRGKLGHAEFVFIPSRRRTGRVAWDYPARFAVIYPAAGMLASPAARTAPGQLRRPLGPTRAEMLLLIGEPVTTTQLATLTGLALGSIGSHLRILLDAGLAERHQSGAHVPLPQNTHRAPATRPARSGETVRRP